MLDADIKSQLQSYLNNLKHPITLIANLDASDKSNELGALLEDIASVSDLVSFTKHYDATQRCPAFTIQRNNSDVSVSFAGIPMGHEFTSLVLALLHTGGHPTKLEQESIDTIAQLDGSYVFEIYISLSCQNCPDVVQALNMMSVINPRIRVTTIDGALFQEEIEQRQIMAVPTVYMNGEIFHQGRASIDELLRKLDSNSAQRDAEKFNAKEPFDVLVVGGGPAGGAAAIYAARKGIRTGLIAERFGGQVQDTMSIENFISVTETEGPKLSAALENHVKAYDVDVMQQQRVTGLKRNELIEISLENGATLKSKSVIIATGARWREMNVPGEQEYRNRGVAYCPHCDGPLFKGKRVAVIGGGNSGVEAAIDLAGLVAHVTLIEFDTQLRADEVLQRKLRSLNNVTIMTHIQSTEVLGDGQKVTGLSYLNRANDSKDTLELDGIFVQIGLVPNTEWLGDTLTLSKHKEIEINARCETSIPGVFAAGDVTTVPYKQIIIAMGEGSKASLSAFDYLIRQI